MRLLRVLGVGAVSVAAACGGGSGDGGTNPPPTQTLGDIVPSVTSLNLAAGAQSTITVTARDTQGATIANPGNFTFQSANPAVAEVTSQGSVLGISSGTTSINVSLTRNGISKSATVSVVVTGALPAAAAVVAGTTANTFTPQLVAISVNGAVTWTFGSVEHNVTFSATAPPGGSSANRLSNTTFTRTFPTAGTFPYDCTLHAGMTGTVFVR